MRTWLTLWFQSLLGGFCSLAVTVIIPGYRSIAGSWCKFTIFFIGGDFLALLASPSEIPHVLCHAGDAASGIWPEITPELREQDWTFNVQDLHMKNVTISKHILWVKMEDRVPLPQVASRPYVCKIYLLLAILGIPPASAIMSNHSINAAGPQPRHRDNHLHNYSRDPSLTADEDIKRRKMQKKKPDRLSNRKSNYLTNHTYYRPSSLQQ